jgi:exodeoxyribonuclease III
VKIATFNINGINKRLPNLMAWLADAAPDIVCLQELKATDRQFPATALADAGYGAVWKGQTSWNGVAILLRGGTPILTREALPGASDDVQARYIEAACDGVIIGCLYAPNGNPRPGPKFDYKLAWTERLIAHAEELWSSGLPIVLAGDFNIVPSQGTFMRPRPTRTMRWCSLKAAPSTKDCSTRAGPTPSARGTRMRPFIPSGTICGTAGRATPDCASTICS